MLPLWRPVGEDRAAVDGTKGGDALAPGMQLPKAWNLSLLVFPVIPAAPNWHRKGVTAVGGAGCLLTSNRCCHMAYTHLRAMYVITL